MRLPSQRGNYSVMTKEGVKKTKTPYPVKEGAYMPPDSEMKTVNKPSYEMPFYKNGVANSLVVQSKYRTRHAGAYTTDKHLSGWDKRERLYPAPQWPGIE